MRRLVITLSALVLALALPAAAGASHINHYHSGTVTNIQGACDVSWEHTGYSDQSAEGETIELSSCDNVQVVLRWYDSDIGAVTIYGPQQNLASHINRTYDILSIYWQYACGNAICQSKA
ncbi:MAG: hypothetical protein V4515_02995 [Chloroflexota bacterium]